MAKVGKVEPSEDTVPVGIVALGPIEMGEDPCFRNRRFVPSPRSFPEMEDPLMEIVRFGIFGKEVSPESSLDKPSDLLSLQEPLFSLSTTFPYSTIASVGRLHSSISIYEEAGKIDPSQGLIAICIRSQEHGFDPIQMLPDQFGRNVSNQPSS